MSSVTPPGAEILSRRWPLLWEAIRSAPTSPPPVYSTTPQPTLIFSGIHLTGGYDRAAEAGLQARLVPTSSPSVWVYGAALGDLPRTLLARPALQQLNVVLLNLFVFAHCLAFADQSDWLADPRVELSNAAGQTEIRTPFAVSPACLRLASDGAARLRDLLALELATPFVRQYIAADTGHDFRLEQNRRFVAQDGDVASLFGRRPGCHAWVAAAGPTLNDQYSRLAQRPPHEPLIAVDAALRPLLKAGLMPEVVVAVDEGERVIRLLETTAAPAPLLVYFPAVQTPALAGWPGKRLAAYPSIGDRFARLIEEFPRGRLFIGGSVLHSAVDLAVQMGAGAVTLLGADFSFPNGQSHAAGVPHVEAIPGYERQPWVFNGRGQRVPTKENLRGYLRELERYIAAHPTLAWYNASRAGAQIAGTEYLDES